MQTTERTVIGVFDDYPAAERAATELQQEGIARSSINIYSNFKTSAAGYGGSEQPEHHEGGFKGFWHRLFGMEQEDTGDELGHYSEAVRRGSSVLAVTVPEAQVERTANVMNRLGAIDIERRSDFYQQTGYKRYDETAEPYSNEEARREAERFRTEKGTQSVPVIEEELQVGKRAVRRGGVRVYSNVVDVPVQEQVNLRDEHVRVERRPADRPVQPGETERLRDRTIEVTETAEEPVVSKRARVREEVVVGKETGERTETIRDNVRRTEVRVDPLEGSDARATTTGPEYEYGYRLANDPRYSGKRWEDAEDTVRSDYVRQYPNSKWDQVKAEIRRGWDKATGKR